MDSFSREASWPNLKNPGAACRTSVLGVTRETPDAERDQVPFPREGLTSVVSPIELAVLEAACLVFVVFSLLKKLSRAFRG